MAKLIHKGKSISTNEKVVGKLMIEYGGYYIENDEAGIKEQVLAKSVDIATKKEYKVFVAQCKN